MTIKDDCLCQKQIICALGNVRGKLDANGDSGSPLFFYDSDRTPKAVGVLVGKLKGIPIFGRIPHHYNWIKLCMKEMSSS